MAEAIGTALAVVGVLGQIFDGCVKAYGYFTSATHLDSDSQKMVTKIRIEEMRLVVWGREWGVAEGRLEEHLRRQDDILFSTPGNGKPVAGSGGGAAGAGAGALRKLAVQILTDLHRTITDFRKLREKYGLLEDDSGSGNTIATGPIEDGKGKKNGSNGLGGANGEGRGWRKEFSLRAKWVIADKDKFSSLLKDLKDFNDGLEQLFPPSRLPALHRTWQHELLQVAQRDVDQLSLLEHASDETYPQLNASAGLKKLRINLDTKPQASFKPTFAFKVPRHALKIADNDSKRSEGFHDRSGTNMNVIIEWVEYDKEAMDERFVHVRRLDDLAKMMHSASDRHPDLHTIDCLGYTDDTAKSRYGLVYKAPQATFSTLHTLISSNDLKTPDLDQRVNLAKTLAIALWSLHSLDWLHKSLCSNNILFFPSAFSNSATQSTAAAAMVPDTSRPYLVGFDASRPDLDTEMSVASKNPSILDIHRHPRSLSGLTIKPYCKTYDIYSLGLVLLEIGLWKVLQTYYKPHHSAERWRDKVIMPVLVPGLGNKTGRLYREVVEKCLTAKDDMTNEEAGQLMEYVVGTLESIRV